MSDFGDREQHTIHTAFRAASFAGICYPDEDFLVRSILQSFGLIQNPKVRSPCILLPHGSWHIMGNTLAAAYRSLIETDHSEDSPKRTISKVVLLGRRHQSDDAGIFLSESDYFETPIGNLTIDNRINAELMSCNTLFEMNDIPHLQEDITETHFPFIKFMFPEAAFIPILIGGFDAKTMTSLANALHTVFKPILDETLFIVTSNSSCHTDPHISKKQSEAFVRMIKEGNGTELLRVFYEKNISACGTLAMAAMLESGLLDNTLVSQVPHSDGSLLEIDKETVHYTALNFSRRTESDKRVTERRTINDRRRGDRRSRDQ
jgi:AmmeMemoRadiSam system protein B